MDTKKLLNLILCFSISILVLFLLGTWQLERLVWKNDLIDKVSLYKALPVIDLNSFNSEDLIKINNRRIKTEGKYKYDSSISIYSKVFKGVVGRHLIVPLKTNIGWILVNRGFIPEKNFDKYIKSGESELVNVKGILTKPFSKSYFIPENDLVKGEWYYLDISEVTNILNLPLLNFVIFEDKNINYDGFPVGGQYNLNNISNNHLQYALTWYSLAFVLCVIMNIFWNKNIKNEQDI